MGQAATARTEVLLALSSRRTTLPLQLPPGAGLLGLPSRLLLLPCLLPLPAAALRPEVRRSPWQSPARDAALSRAQRRRGALALPPPPRAPCAPLPGQPLGNSPLASPSAVPGRLGSERPTSLGARGRRAAGTVRPGRGGRRSRLGVPGALWLWILPCDGGCTFAPAASCFLSPDSYCLSAAPST